MSSDHLEQPGETGMPEPGGAENGTPDHRADSGWSWRLVATMILGAILIVLVIIALGIYGADRNDKANTSDQTLGDLAGQMRAACLANPTEARKVFGDVCGKAKVIDDRPVGEKGDQGAKGDKGDPGTPGLTTAQVQAIVATAIRNYEPTLTPSQVNQIARVAAPKVVRPRDGRTPTEAELQPLVAVAVTSFCGEDRCVGKGLKGDPGKDAPPVTDERLSALIDTSLKAYCAQHNGCVGADSTVPGPKGEQGDKGAKGDPGEPGPDTSAVKCASMSGELQELTVTTTDPLTQAKILVCVLK
ncbi:hypothetical protein ACFPJ1_40765 [Kribbella qitaiheensis]|uniref:hypothetical protein n=1 Tax=Kribbella qitaiheensis TaxID=1544730 RepID=UPI0036239103